MRKTRLLVGAFIVRFGFWVASGQWLHVEATFIPKDTEQEETPA